MRHMNENQYITKLFGFLTLSTIQVVEMLYRRIFYYKVFYWQMEFSCWNLFSDILAIKTKESLNCKITLQENNNKYKL